MKKLIFIVLLLPVNLVLGQDFLSNALLFSRVKPTVSARVQGMGGPMSALGGDYSSALVNPAGLGLYNRNEVTITPALNFISSSGVYYGVSSPTESRSTFGVPGFSLVLNTPTNNERGFLGGSFGISYTRTNDLHQDFRYQGVNDQNSIIDFFIEDAGTIDPEELLYIDRPGAYFYSLTALAYNNYLTEEMYNQNGNVIGYGTVLDFSRVRQTEISERKGSQAQWNLSYGANFSDRFFAGINIGIASLRYKLSQVFREDQFDYNDGAPEALSNFNITERYNIRGSGVNLALGVIARPVDFLQVGVSYTSPTFYGITDKYHARIDSRWNNFEYFEDEVLGDVYQEFPEEQVYEYNITTPMRLNAGLALIQKFGLLTGNIEYVNYGKAKYSSEIAGEFAADNDDIRASYNSVINWNIGAEFRHEFLRFRAGYGQMAEPVTRSANREIQTYAAGIGARLQRFFVDLGVNYSTTNSERVPYFTFVGDADPLATQEFKRTSYLLTFGFTF